MKGIKSGLKLGASAIALYMIAAPALAQESEVEAVTVTGIRGSMRDSLQAKRNSPLTIEAISSKDIGQLPDVTIAEELNRLPGMNTTRDRGHASQAAVRGLGPRLVLGLVNGREVASSEPDQNVRWEIYPSEVVSSALVYKSQSADIISGGIAATIDIQTVQPLDYEGPSLTLRAGPQYNDGADKLPHYDPWGLRASGAWIGHLSDTFAVALSASFQREKNGYPSFQGWGYNLANGGTAGDVTGDAVPDSTPWGAQSEVKEIQQDRTAIMGAAQWRPTASLEFKFDALYSAYDISEDQFQAWYGRNGSTGDYTSPQPGVPFACYGATSWAYNCPGGNVTVDNGVIAGGALGGSYVSVSNVIADYSEEHSLFVTGLNGKWTSGDWIASLDVSHSNAERTNRWQSLITEVYPPSMLFNWGRGQPFVEFYNETSAPFTTPYNPADTTIQTLQSYTPGQSAGPEHTKDRITAGQFDATRAVSESFITALSFGGRIADREKQHRYFFWYECPGGGASITNTCGSSYTLPSAQLENFNMPGFNVPPMLYGDFGTLASAAFTNYSNGEFSMPAGAEQLVQHWNVGEKVYEGYVKAEFGGNLGSIPFTGAVGVRLAKVDTTSSGYSNGAPITVKHDYTDVLPSLNVNFNVTEDQIVRLGAAIAVARPPLDELRTGFSLSTAPPFTGSGGNPQLDPYKATQLDLGYEWYFHEESLLAVALFYKKLDSFIGYGSSTQVIGGTTYTMFQPVNGNGGELTGLEATFQTPFYFLPEFFENFGVYANYAFVNSTVHEFAPATNPMEGSGLAKHTAELDLWYSHEGLEARVAYKVHSPFTVIAGWNSQTLTRIGWEHTLDASVSYQWDEHFGVRLQGRNLTDSVSRTYWDNNPTELARYDTFGRSFLVDVTYRN